MDVANPIAVVQSIPNNNFKQLALPWAYEVIELVWRVVGKRLYWNVRVRQLECLAHLWTQSGGIEMLSKDHAGYAGGRSGCVDQGFLPALDVLAIELSQPGAEAIAAPALSRIGPRYFA